MPRRFALAALATLGSCALAAPLVAQTGPNLIDPNAWTGSFVDCPGSAPDHFCLPAFLDPNPIGGDPENPIYGPATPSFAEQSVGTVAGRSYFLSFVSVVHLHELGGGRLSVFWGGTPVTLDWVFDEHDAESRGSASAVLPALGASTTLTFQSVIVGTCSGIFCGDWGQFTEIGDVSVRQLADPTVTTPEPATFALVAGGLALVVAAARRRGNA